MFAQVQEVFIEFTTIFFILLVTIIIITAILYHNRKRRHKIDLLNFQETLTQAQLEVQEQTMQTIGAELHDNVGQLLSLISFTLGSIGFDEPGKIPEKIEAAIDLTGRSIKEMRLLGKLLQGEQLINMGLADAIRHEISWVERSGHYNIICTIDEEMPAENNPDKDLIIFRVLQEALNNIIKHANARHIHIKLNYTGEQLILHINDDGNGFDTTGRSAGMGLYNIQKRVQIVGGQAVIQSAYGKGTNITIFIPYP